MMIRIKIATDEVQGQTIVQEEKVVTDDIQDEKVVTDDVQDEGITTEDEKDEQITTEDEKDKKVTSESRKEEQVTNVRKSQRIRKQRMVIHPDQIGDCDDTQDLDYKQLIHVSTNKVVIVEDTALALI